MISVRQLLMVGAGAAGLLALTVVDDVFHATAKNDDQSLSTSTLEATSADGIAVNERAFGTRSSTTMVASPRRSNNPFVVVQESDPNTSEQQKSSSLTETPAEVDEEFSDAALVQHDQTEDQSSASILQREPVGVSIGTADDFHEPGDQSEPEVSDFTFKNGNTDPTGPSSEAVSGYIRGRVLYEDGLHVIGARISAVANGQGRPEFEFGKKRFQTVSDETGFHLDEMPPGEYIVAVSDSGPGQSQKKLVRTNQHALDFVLERRRSVELSGQILDTDSIAVSNAVIKPLMLGARQSATDEYGRFSVSLMVDTDRRNLAVAVEHADYESVQVPVDLGSSTDSVSKEIDIRLQKLAEARIDAHGVVRSSNVAVEGVRVTLASQASAFQESALTDGVGYFRIGGVPSNEPMTVTVDGNDQYASRTMHDVEIDEGDSYLSLSVNRSDTGTLHGIMTDFEGNPVSQFSLVVRSRDDSQWAVPVVGDEMGLFEVENVPSGEIYLDSGVQPHLSFRGIRVSSSTENFVRLQLPRGSMTLAGVVTDSIGNPIPNAEVALLRSEYANGIRIFARQVVESDGLGEFSLSHMPSGENELIVSKTGYMKQQITHDISLDGSSVRLELSSI